MHNVLYFGSSAHIATYCNGSKNSVGALRSQPDALEKFNECCTANLMFLERSANVRSNEMQHTVANCSAVWHAAAMCNAQQPGAVPRCNRQWPGAMQLPGYRFVANCVTSAKLC